MFTTWLVIAAIYTALLLATGIVGTVIYDLIAIHKGWPTVSSETLMLSRRSLWIAVFISGFLCFIVGVLAGHLFFPQYIM